MYEYDYNALGRAAHLPPLPHLPLLPPQARTHCHYCLLLDALIQMWDSVLSEPGGGDPVSRVMGLLSMHLPGVVAATMEVLESGMLNADPAQILSVLIVLACVQHNDGVRCSASRLSDEDLEQLLAP